ncbi:hypothetical protein [Metabacillus halosaccharovorans]|uniref:Uncharacterized protein n=1 Tax=Metabacillus halosaccharovorans TaxID=930124 RepID=A0ABT3DH22_9BACI|nr:hypothetical protein [Metabacillus halosaccharovorans]MCV9886277.1 hypothetical protein [Metabacillus halosaccharovorans]
MPKFTLFHDYVDGNLVPYWFVMTFRENEIEWNKSVFYITIEMHLEHSNRDHYNNSIPSYPVYLKDLIFNDGQPGKVGIHLKGVRKRLNKHKIDPYIINQFIIPFPDTHDLLKLMPNKKKILLLRK